MISSKHSCQPCILFWEKSTGSSTRGPSRRRFLPRHRSLSWLENSYVSQPSVASAAQSSWVLLRCPWSDLSEFFQCLLPTPGDPEIANFY